MTTINPRINVTLEADIAALLGNLAEKEGKSVSGMAKSLILDALERHEDMALSRIAQLRDSKGSKTISHDDAWK
jgi:phage gp16-like protein